MAVVCIALGPNAGLSIELWISQSHACTAAGHLLCAEPGACEQVLCTTMRRTDVTDANTPLTWSLPLPSEDLKTNGYDAANAAIAAWCEAIQPRAS